MAAAAPLNTRALPFVKLGLVLSTALGQALAAPFLVRDAGDDFVILGHGDKTQHKSQSGMQLFISLLSIAGLVVLGGIFAGLTLALMGLDELHLQVLSDSGTDTERRRASKVLRLLGKGKHWVLVVLLLGNVIVNETLPIFLSDFGGGLAAVITSTLLIVIFGEIVPQSICARFGLAIGAFCAPLVHITMLLMAPVAWPTAKLLDWCLGEDHGTTYRKAELKTFVSLHQTLGAENLSEDEVTIIRAVLDLNEKNIRNVMTPIADVFTLSADTILDEEGVSKLVNSGYSRVPVHEPGKPDAISGMLLVKKLIQYDPEDAQPVSWFTLTPLPEASPDLTLLDCLNYFQQGRSHMLLVSTHPGESKGALGVVTLEDVIEELIGEEIIDETDIFVDVHNKVKVIRQGDRPGKQDSWSGMIEGIIERRRKHGGSAKTPLRSNYGMPQSSARTGNASQNPNPGTRAMDKVQIKRTASPAGTDRTLSRRPSEGVNGGDASQTPRLSRHGVSIEDESPTAVTSISGVVHSTSPPAVNSSEDTSKLSSSEGRTHHQPFIVEFGEGGSGPSAIFARDNIPSDPGAEERARREAEEQAKRDAEAVEESKKKAQQSQQKQGSPKADTKGSPKTATNGLPPKSPEGGGKSLESERQPLLGGTGGGETKKSSGNNGGKSKKKKGRK